MQLTNTISLILATAATAVSAGTLNKRCWPVFDPEYNHGFLPPAPCWQIHDTSCTPHLRQGTQMTLDSAHNLAVVYGVNDVCVADIHEELAREADGRKIFNWQRDHGKLTLIPGAVNPEWNLEGNWTLVISNMPDATVASYAQLTYWP